MIREYFWFSGGSRIVHILKSSDTFPVKPEGPGSSRQGSSVSNGDPWPGCFKVFEFSASKWQLLFKPTKFPSRLVSSV